MTGQAAPVVPVTPQKDAPPPAAQRLAEALARFCRAEGNDWGVTLHAEPVRQVQRPFSLVHWYRVAGAGVRAEVVVKAARGASGAARETADAEARAAQRLEAVFAGIPELGVVVPLRTYVDLLAVVTPAIAAPSLGSTIEARGGWWPGAETLRDLVRGCEMAGRWLGHLHDACPAPEPWTLETMREDVMLRVRLLREFPAHYGMPDFLAGRVERWLDAELGRASAADLVCSETHRDFSPSNMLYDGQQLRVLDLGTLRQAPRLLDVTRFLHQIALLRMKPRYRPSTRRALDRAFTSGYNNDALLASTLVTVFMARHELSHWLGAARRGKRRSSAASAILCQVHARTTRRLVSTTYTPAQPR